MRRLGRETTQFNFSSNYDSLGVVGGSEKRKTPQGDRVRPTKRPGQMTFVECVVITYRYSEMFLFCMKEFLHEYVSLGSIGELRLVSSFVYSFQCSSFLLVECFVGRDDLS